MARSIIHDAAFNLDVAALRRGLDAGEAPDLLEDEYGSLRLPLQDAIVYGCALPHKSIEKRLAFIEALLEAGASVDVTTNGGRTALHCAVMQLDRRQYPTDFELIVDRLLRAGADVNATFPVNATNEEGTSVLAMAASNGRSTVITKLLSAGAVDPKGFDEPLRRALISHRPRNCAVLMRAGAVLRREIHPEYYAWLKDPYLRKVYETPGGFLCRNQNPPSVDALDDFHTGGFKAYEKAHRQRLTATFLPKFPSLPAEIVSHIVSYGFNCGCY